MHNQNAARVVAGLSLIYIPSGYRIIGEEVAFVSRQALIEMKAVVDNCARKSSEENPMCEGAKAMEDYLSVVKGQAEPTIRVIGISAETVPGKPREPMFLRCAFIDSKGKARQFSRPAASLEDRDVVEETLFRVAIERRAEVRTVGDLDPATAFAVSGGSSFQAQFGALASR